MSKRALGLIAALLIAGSIGAPSTSLAGASPTDEAMPVATRFPAEAIVGEWVTPKEENRPPGRIRFTRQNDGSYVGVLAWSSEPKKDVNNKDPSLRDRSLVGVVLIWNLRYDDGEYSDGYVYNPEDGATYRMNAEVLGPENLKVHGYLGIPLLGQTKIWTRYHP
jgi:uncharacterized protein (DUF2147 family)